MDHNEKVKNLREQLKAAEEEERAERKARADSVEREWKFTWELVTEPRLLCFDRLRPDCGVTKWHLKGETVNKQECLDVGKHEQDLRDGGMMYFVNTLNNRIITSTGGGHLFISDAHSFFHGAEDKAERIEDGDRIYAELEKICESGIESMDVTKLILSQRKFAF